MVKRTLVAWFVASALLLPALSSQAMAQAEEPGFRLSLADCLKMALENNLDLVSARLDPEISEQSVVSRKSFFDPILTSSLFHSESEKEVFDLRDLTSSTVDAANVGLTQEFQYGASLTATLSGGRQQAEGALLRLENSYGSDVDLIYDMPLLQGLGVDVATEQLVLAKGDLEISREELRRQAHLILESVEGAYWNVAASRRALEVARKRLTRAQDLLDLNRKKVEVGTMAPIEITQAEAGVADTEESVIVAEADIGNAEDELRRLMAIPHGDPIWSRPIDTIDTPRLEEADISLDQAIATALAERPEISSWQQSLRNAGLSERVARKMLRPGLDFRVQVNPSGNNFTPGPGLDGIFGTPDDQPVPDGKLVESLEEIPEFKSYDWQVSLAFRYPLGNRQAKANHAIARLNREKAEISLRDQEQTIRVEVRRAVRNVESGIKRVRAATENVRLQAEKLAAEQKKFDNGMSTSFEVLTFQNDLADAELRVIRAAVDYTKALAALEVAKGTLLQARGLSLAP